MWLITVKLNRLVLAWQSLLAHGAAHRARLASQILIPSGNVVLLAGTTGVSGYAGDGGNALQSRMNNPYAAISDGLGGLWIADYSNYAVRRVLPAAQCYQMGTVQSCATTYVTGANVINCTLTGEDGADRGLLPLHNAQCLSPLSQACLLPRPSTRGSGRSSTPTRRAPL